MTWRSGRPSTELPTSPSADCPRTRPPRRTATSTPSPARSSPPATPASSANSAPTSPTPCSPAPPTSPTAPHPARPTRRAAKPSRTRLRRTRRTRRLRKSLSRSSLSRATLSRATLSRATLSRATLSRATLSRATLSRERQRRNRPGMRSTSRITVPFTGSPTTTCTTAGVSAATAPRCRSPGARCVVRPRRTASRSTTPAPATQPARTWRARTRLPGMRPTPTMTTLSLPVVPPWGRSRSGTIEPASRPTPTRRGNPSRRGGLIPRPATLTCHLHRPGLPRSRAGVR
ncbi:pentapeptide repeat-containing protein [Actinopolymorpha sp. NPDC004070]|uniref:pentapeptide repeat-containing protein n=1 Tax=Actinopolymorpha sp. NPDC004070 TaxID=3154548 RepID=UPI0033A7B0A2